MQMFEEILEVINEKFNSNNYPELYKPYKFGSSVVVFWNCGCLVLQDSLMHTFSEDDGRWCESPYNGITCSIAYLQNITKCFNIAIEFAKNNKNFKKYIK